MEEKVFWNDPQNYEFDVKITKSPTQGNCFTTKITKPLQLKETFIFILNRKWDLVVYVHNDGDEIWLPWSAYPYARNKFRINMKTEQGSVL